MPKFVRKPIVVEAEAYRPGLEDGVEAYYYDDKGSLSQAWAASGFGLGPNGEVFNEDGAVYVPWLRTVLGKHYIMPGDYIVTNPDGSRFLSNADGFETCYEPVEQPLAEAA